MTQSSSNVDLGWAAPSSSSLQIAAKVVGTKTVKKSIEETAANRPALEPPDSHHLSAAEGWLLLGNHREANDELKRITLQARFHPDVLLVRWEIYARDQHWEFAHTIAHGMVALTPDEPVGWINRSFALHQMKRTQEAWRSLLPAARKFPNNPTVAYNLACYACQLGLLEESSKWLQKAIATGDAEKIKTLARQDPDLEPLWKTELR
jgi:predicted Zn-dependent protease